MAPRPNKRMRSLSTTSREPSIAPNIRAKSRQSTISVHSNPTQPSHAHPQQFFGADGQYSSAAHHSVADEAFRDNMIARCLATGLQDPPEASFNDVEISLVTKLQQGQQALDRSLHDALNGLPGNQDYHRFGGDASNRTQSPTEIASLDGKENLGNDEFLNGTHQEMLGDGSKRKKGASASQANDVELRRLFKANEHRDLRDVAMEVLKDNKGPKSEKAKQVFGMLWLSAHCRTGSGSVPRGRVFTAYATRCGSERIPPLNPASFGKLVRIIFPNVSTRRLGMRGESKYHYTELALDVQESNQESSALQQAQRVMVESYDRVHEVGKANLQRSQLPADATFFPPTDSPLFPPSNMLLTPQLEACSLRETMSSGTLYVASEPGGNRHSPQMMIRRPLQFSHMKPEPFGGQVDLELPSIQKYLPPGADQDAVNSLVSVYRGHCLLAIDNFRFCKTDRFCESYKSLVGLLTLPGQRLLAHRPISDWIRECDWLKYRKMLPILDQCLDSQMPDAAMEHLNAVAQNLCSWIAQFFQSTPGWTMNAMLGPASIFVSLIDRFLRVNHAANDLVSIVDDLGCREQLWNDWTKNVNPFKVVANSLTGTGHARLISILTDEARFLLGPLSDGAPGVEQHTIASRPFDPSIYEMASNNMVSRLIVFVNSLPTRFPRVDARTLLNMIDVIGSNISRNVSINGSHALPTWWRIKMFIDELSYWLAERGGFVENGPMSMYPVPPSQSRPDHFSENRTSQHRERHQSAPQANLDAGEFPSRQQQPGAGTDVKPNSNDDTSRHHTDQASNHAHSQHIYPDHGIFHQGSDPPASHHEIPEALKEGKGRQMREGTSDTEEDDGLRQFPDDSGIGMGADDEFGINAKYNSFVEGVHGSDPADVVVC